MIVHVSFLLSVFVSFDIESFIVMLYGWFVCGVGCARGLLLAWYVKSFVFARV